MQHVQTAGKKRSMSGGEVTWADYWYANGLGAAAAPCSHLGLIRVPVEPGETSPISD